MKKEYDFSKGERGKFYHKGAKFRLPIYLNLDLQNQIERIARKKRRSFGEIVHGLLKKEVQLMQ